MLELSTGESIIVPCTAQEYNIWAERIIVEFSCQGSIMIHGADGKTVKFPWSGSALQKEATFGCWISAVTVLSMETFLLN